jgi:hypothetical protein
MARGRTGPLPDGRITRRAAAAAASARAGEPSQALSRRASSAPAARGAANPSERARRRATLRSSPFRGPLPPGRCGAEGLLRAGESGEAVVVVDWRWRRRDEAETKGRNICTLFKKRRNGDVIKLIC